ncbi:uncharacterized protein C8Q71DRAFT_571697 [Rhodofomes roseus]|uniref:Uncharacterized protein n=1 Tax=Rhodofomes roseus TaxID=34475 RepID=A0ABQ8KJ11_9APHY|nr:uncharacterized protein C8Q71DRAFT_571697 [Rhodofomes roseus]KAH9837989.1 hypothetical protein C8Q71DRAFT_571697 [Rhodofomes roseus]
MVYASTGCHFRAAALPVASVLKPNSLPRSPAILSVALLLDAQCPSAPVTVLALARTFVSVPRFLFRTPATESQSSALLSRRHASSGSWSGCPTTVSPSRTPYGRTLLRLVQPRVQPSSTSVPLNKSLSRRTTSSSCVPLSALCTAAAWRNIESSRRSSSLVRLRLRCRRAMTVSARGFLPNFDG